MSNFTPKCSTILTDANITETNFSYRTWKSADIEVNETPNGFFINGAKAQKTAYRTEFTSMPQWPGSGGLDGLLEFLANEFDIAIETSRNVDQKKVFGWDNTPTRYSQVDVLLIKI